MGSRGSKRTLRKQMSELGLKRKRGSRAKQQLSKARRQNSAASEEAKAARQAARGR